tara:strand:- start:13231 stop:13389 length:159 start_codon:yes stop_codon:yes gene_type:complete
MANRQNSALSEKRTVGQAASIIPSTDKADSRGDGLKPKIGDRIIISMLAFFE